MSKRKTPKDNILIREVKNNLSGSDIGKKYKVSKVCICRHLKRLGINRENLIGKKGSEHSQWKGGRGLKCGYWTVYCPNHPRAMKNRRVYEHILVAEKKYGRFIKKGEPIHHIDFDRKNNNPDNLYLCENHKEHQNLHYSLEEVARELYRKGILGFKNGKYYWK